MPHIERAPQSFTSPGSAAAKSGAHNGAPGDAFHQTGAVAMSESTPPSRFPPFLLTRALSHRATAALAVAVRRRDATQAELRTVIEGCVRLLRDRGMTAGAMLVTMKAFVRHSMDEPALRNCAGSADAAEFLMDRMVSWCVEEFYRTPTRS